MANLNATGAKSTKSARTKPVRRSAPCLSITDLAVEIARIDKLVETLDKGANVAGVVKSKCADGSQPRREAAVVSLECSLRHDMMEERREALASALFHLDPGTPSEVLSLALVLQTELDCFIANYTDDNDTEARRAEQMVRRAYRAVVLGLVRHVGLTSPLSDMGLSERCQASFEAATAAARRAAPYLAMSKDKIDKLAESSQA